MIQRGEQGPESKDIYPIMRTTPAFADPIIDGTSATVTYYGYAPLGTKQTDAAWKIVRVTRSAVAAPYTQISEYPNTQDSYSFAWSDRLTLIYSR